MILTVTLNAALDKTHVVEGFSVGGCNLPLQSLALAGGKGINVARALTALGEPTLALGLLAGDTGELIKACLMREGINHHFDRLESGESRTCLALVHRDTGEQTELNEPGALVDPAAMERFVARFASSVASASWVALSGSLPPGLEAGAFVRLAGLARASGVPLSLDTSGRALPHALACRPEVFKPNQPEAELLLGQAIQPENLAASLAALVALGARLVALSLGAAGAAVATADEAWFLPAPEVAVVNPIGSGDAFLASLISARLAGLSVSEAARRAVAAGSANAAVLGAAACTRAQIEALLPRVRALPLSEAAWTRHSQLA